MRSIDKQAMVKKKMGQLGDAGEVTNQMGQFRLNFTQANEVENPKFFLNQLEWQPNITKQQE